MGIGKLAIGVVMMGVLAFGVVTAFSMAQYNKTTDALGVSTASTAELTNVVVGTGGNLMVPLLMISGIVLLSGFFMIFKKVRV